MSNPDCQPIITPDDCAPYGAPATDTPSTPVPAPAGDPVPEISPVTPPIEHLGDLELPDLSVITDAAGRSAVVAAVVIVVLIMTVAVAAQRPVEPHRLRNFATAALLLPLSSVAAGGAWSTPWVLLWSGAGEVAAADFTGIAPMLLIALPAGMLAATYFWAEFLHKNASVGQKSLARTERIAAAMQKRRDRAAARTAAHGAPYTAGNNVVLGVLSEHVSAAPLGVWRSLAARHMQWLTVPMTEVGRHVAWVGTTGSGKTTGLERHFVAVQEASWTAWHRWADVPGMKGKHPRPLMVLIACKGGEDDRKFGEKIRRISLKRGIDPERIAMVLPGGDRLNIWDMPARDLRGVLSDLMGSGQASTSEGQHFDEMRKRIVSLVVDAPIGPPRSSDEFLARLNEQTLIDAWQAAPDVVRQVKALQAEKVPQLDDALIKMSNLFGQLKDQDGNGVFDGGRDLSELDVLYVTVPGMDKDAARAQVAAILRMVMQRAGRTKAEDRRAVYLLLDEASAVATEQGGALGLVEIAERGRSQGVSITFSAQSKEGLAADPWTLSRLLSSCAGGLLLGYSENAGDLCKHLGSIRRMLPSRHLIKGQRHGDEGQTSYGEKWLVDPDRIRQMATGDVVYGKAGHAWYGRVVPVDIDALKPLPGTTTHTEPAPAAVPSPA
ncbi:hypothetical protein [Nocardia sp. NPDC051750]|uniref:hypothetical protein n=1 Tax=Nocardia sp. NPDC051750 TaxID=3364325 RepID=UPI0037A63DE5